MKWGTGGRYHDHGGRTEGSSLSRADQRPLRRREADVQQKRDCEANMETCVVEIMKGIGRYRLVWLNYNAVSRKCCRRVKSWHTYLG